MGGRPKPAGVVETAHLYPGRAVVQALLNVLFAAGTFVAVATALRHALPFPNVPSLKPKYTWFAARKDRYETLFVGSSRFYHQIIPAEFDALVGACPRTGQEQSFNFAYDGVWPPESYYLIGRLLRLRPRRLRWVFIDAMEIKAELEDPEHPTERQVWWHDWHHTRMAIEGRRDARLYLPAKVAGVERAHWALFARVFTNLGRGAEIAGRVLGEKEVTHKAPAWLGGEGYAPGPDVPLAGKELAEYNAAVKLLRTGLLHTDPGPVLTRAMTEIIQAVRAAGAEPIFVIAPTIHRLENWTGVPAGAALYTFNDPQQYPELFDPLIHYDSWHLNERGAHIFTRLLAERFVREHHAQ